eukprot:CAMPEP_0197629304 /NCGR_PEP_ID=MMETSP1338-20131121/7217_1 /TAXON_ID=43686 ORGANISM="Pelagodinium beii, Strain RCC1491" /NCGR_SAMPLE_ID=MMETSP1338 /ASSEMBLY_ACC=CAM_ASM_000754 /LENGTH=51 /DNA_ID=CAMNT_0043200335 /DNA_START=231 /DNA_END=386 /DNA_ORIENTATION=-
MTKWQLPHDDAQGIQSEKKATSLLDLHIGGLRPLKPALLRMMMIPVAGRIM